MVQMDRAVGIDVDQGAGLIVPGRGKADAEFHRGQGDALADHTATGIEVQHRLTAGVIVAAGFELGKDAGQDLVLDLLMIGGELAVFVKVQLADFQRVAAKRIGDILDHALGQRRQVGVDRAEPLPSRRRGRQSSDLDLGVREQQPEEFSPGIPTRSGDGNLDHAA